MWLKIRLKLRLWEQDWKQAESGKYCVVRVQLLFVCVSIFFVALDVLIRKNIS